MSKRYNKTKRCSVLLGKKPSKVNYENKKCSPVPQILGEQTENKSQVQNNRFLRRLQG
ncbi:hypothetical protein [Velocimicrobium porci]|uniref:hypothetical protein n=1 Tax=Velocimicrobium porci TaxID=2606634 RepID=UPI0012B38057|nr:hypothetical protein [Velocimicrobium porci]